MGGQGGKSLPDETLTKPGVLCSLFYCHIYVQEKGTWKNKQTVITFTRYGFSLRSDVAKTYIRGATHSQLKSYFYILFVVKRNLS